MSNLNTHLRNLRAHPRTWRVAHNTQHIAHDGQSRTAFRCLLGVVALMFALFHLLIFAHFAFISLFCVAKLLRIQPFMAGAFAPKILYCCNRLLLSLFAATMFGLSQVIKFLRHFGNALDASAHSLLLAALWQQIGNALCCNNNTQQLPAPTCIQTNVLVCVYFVSVVALAIKIFVSVVFVIFVASSKWSSHKMVRCKQTATNV